MSFTKLLEIVDTRSKDSVFGYIRQSRDKVEDAIPMMIQYCCLRYYFVRDYFVKPTEDIFEVSNHGQVLSKEDKKFTWNCENYGNIIIDPTSQISVYRWRIKFAKLDNRFEISLGIQSPKHKDWGLLLKQHDGQKDVHKYDIWEKNVITMELDMKEKTLRYLQYGRDLPTYNVKIHSDQKYRLMVAVFYGKVKLCMTKYEEEYF